MKIKKVAILFSLILLVSCSKNTTKPEDPQYVFKKELMQIYSLYDDEGKILLADMTENSVLDMVNTMLEESDIDDANVSFDKSKVGIVKAEGKRVNALKLPVLIKFNSDEDSTRKFFTKIIALDNRILINDIIIDNLDDIYSTDCELVFCGNQDLATENDSSNNLVTLEEVSNNVDVQEKIVLRNNDFLMVLRPHNSDSAAISFGASNDVEGDSYVYFNTNERISFDIEFINEGNKYFGVYNDINGNIVKREFSLKNDSILIDVLSCKKESTQDNIGVDFTIKNSTNKEIDVKVFDDFSKRVNIKKV